jgi:hypothetical protein
MAEIINGYKIRYAQEAFPSLPGVTELRIFKSISIIQSADDPNVLKEREDLTFEFDYGVSVQTLKIPLKKLDPEGTGNENIAYDPDGPFPIEQLTSILLEIDPLAEDFPSGVQDKIEEVLSDWIRPAVYGDIYQIINDYNLSIGELLSSSEVNALSSLIQDYIEADVVNPSEQYKVRDLIVGSLLKDFALTERSEPLQPFTDTSYTGSSTATLNLSSSGEASSAFNLSGSSKFITINLNRDLSTVTDDFINLEIDVEPNSTDSLQGIYDPDAILYGPSISSSVPLEADLPTLLAGSDDDSGVGTSCKLNKKLSPGYYFLRVAAVYPQSGNYAVKVSARVTGLWVYCSNS